MADLRILQHYLHAGIQVHHPAHGLGTLVGLPYCTSPEKPRVTVRFEHDPAGLPAHRHDYEYYDLAPVTPVLHELVDWLFNDLPAVERELPPTVQRTLRAYGAGSLEEFAQTIDFLRAQGVAVGLAPGQQYRRKEVPHG